HHEVVRFVPPEEFEEYGKVGERLGFKFVASAPLVRSSFHAADILAAGKGK
ncbi:MAG: lipoyl synthase, partial [Chloroflexi bacterium]|nr:lipoyl synthase [Chloroflexota bacterium]